MDPLFTLLKTAFLTNQPDSQLIAENMRASRAMDTDVADAIERRVREEELRHEYTVFCDNLKRDLTPIEGECNGFPTFTEWLKEREHA